MFLSASITAVSSIRLLVVTRSEPPISETLPAGVTEIAPHPPGPGFPELAPSAKIRIEFLKIEVMSHRYQKRTRSESLFLKGLFRFVTKP